MIIDVYSCICDNFSIIAVDRLYLTRKHSWFGTYAFISFAAFLEIKAHSWKKMLARCASWRHSTNSNGDWWFFKTRQNIIHRRKRPSIWFKSLNYWSISECETVVLYISFSWIASQCQHVPLLFHKLIQKCTISVECCLTELYSWHFQYFNMLNVLFFSSQLNLETLLITRGKPLTWKHRQWPPTSE